MTTKKAFERLEKLGVDSFYVGSMNIQYGHSGIGICITVNKIIENFNSTQEIEDEVENILALILKRHFK